MNVKESPGGQGEEGILGRRKAHRKASGYHNYQHCVLWQDMKYRRALFNSRSYP